MAYEFSLSNIKGDTIHQSDLKGKVVLIDFWYVGCGACAVIHPYLDSLKRLFNENDFAMISICLDKKNDKKAWEKAVADGKLCSTDGINLYAPGYNGKDPAIAKRYYIEGCPTLILVDKIGRLTLPPSDPRSNLGMIELLRMIKEYVRMEY
jgi:cytochrome oxidase Cu insertion factor (SCO1/SenC/PrrC family)